MRLGGCGLVECVGMSGDGYFLLDLMRNCLFKIYSS